MERKGATTERPKGMFSDVESGEFPSSLMKANASFEAAMANCIFRDEEQRNAVVIYHSQLTMFEMKDEIEQLTNFLNGSISIGGYSRVLGASSYTGVIYPASLGVKLSKEGEKAWAEVNAEKIRRQQRGDGQGEEH